MAKNFHETQEVSPTQLLMVFKCISSEILAHRPNIVAARACYDNTIVGISPRRPVTEVDKAF